MNRNPLSVVVVLAVMMVAGGARGADMQAGRAGERVAVLSGGVGAQEQQALAAREKDFNLKLVFSVMQGNYLANVAVIVRDAKGQALMEHVAQGPLLLAQLPAGIYQVSATHDGKTVNREIRVSGGRLHTEHFRWRANPREDLAISPWADRG